MEQADHSERRLAAILSADVRGYSRMMAEDEADTVRAVKQCREIFGARVREHRGRIVDSPGDNILAEFPSAVEAVQCAVEVQHELADRNDSLAPARRMEFRIGIHLGDVISDEGRIYGDGVNIAARLEGLAQPGGISISREVHDQIRGKLDIDLEDLGERQVKNIPRPVRVLRVRMGPTPPARTENSSRLRQLTLATLAVVVAVVLAVAGGRFFGSELARQSAAANHSNRSIAVLPLENLSGDPAQEYFADGMTDELITDLAKISGLTVISRTSVMKFKGEHRTRLPEIARALNVSTILEGSVLRVGDKVRISAQLIDAASDKHLWAESYERDIRDVLTLQDELASTIAHQIDVELTPNERARFAKPRPVDPDALEACLKSGYFLGKQTVDGYQKAREYFEQAIKIAPDFALGYAELAGVYVGSADLFVSNQEAIPKAKELLEVALRLDDTNAPAHSWLGVIHWSYDYDWVASERENRRAIELAPGAAYTHGGCGLMLYLQARFDEAERELKLAQLLDPLDPLNYVNMGALLVARGDYRNALEQCRKALEIDPNYWVTYSYCLGHTYDQIGNQGEALKAFEKGVAIEPGPVPEALLGAEYARSGNREQAHKVIEQLNRQSAQTYVLPCGPALVYLALGENNTALNLEEKAYQERSGCVTDLKVNHGWDPLRSEPRFIALLKKVGLTALMAARDRLEKSGIKRSAIDAGYELNGLELYRFPRRGEETIREEAGIPMITSAKVDEYTIAVRPFPGTETVGRIFCLGPFGLRSREMYVLRRIHHQKSASSGTSRSGG